MQIQKRETNTQVANKNDVRTLLGSEAVKQQIALALPKHMNADRMARVALTAINRVPKLLLCTPSSVLSCLMQCSQYGLEPDGRHAHLIPYGDQCQLIIDYKGLVALVRRSGEVKDVYADVVCANDQFEFQKGKDRFLKHKYDIRKPRGEVICAYSYVVPKDAEDSFEIMTTEEINAVRERSRAGKSGPWVTDWSEMAKKTVFRRHSKWLPFSSELQEAIAADDEDFEHSKPQIQVNAPALFSMPEDQVPGAEVPAIEASKETAQPELVQ